jgi:putative transposase
MVCQEDAYFKKLVRYIHLNPMRASMVPGVKELHTYCYGGHSVLMEKRNRPWQDVRHVLEYFGKSANQARKVYLNFMQ